MPDNTVAIWILCVSFTVFLILRFPVALVLALSSLATLWYLEMPIVVVAQQILQGINAFSLLAIPFFIMTGQLLGAGGWRVASSILPMFLSGDFPAGFPSSTRWPVCSSENFRAPPSRTPVSFSTNRRYRLLAAETLLQYRAIRRRRGRGRK